MTLRILLVGIEASVSALIRAALCDRGHEIVEGSSFEKHALTAAASKADLVICEIPTEGDGEGELVALQKLGTPVIIMSRQPVALHRYTRQPWAYLTKPLRIRQLVELAEEAGRGGGRRP